MSEAEGNPAGPAARTFSLLPQQSRGLLERALGVVARGRAAIRQSVGIPPETHVVICGFPRGGTSLLYNMMAATLPAFRRDPFESYAAFRLHRTGDYITKAPLDVFHVPELAAFNMHRKRLPVIVMVRDIADLLTSRHPLVPGEFFMGWDNSWWPQNEAMDRWSYDAPGIVAVHHAIQRLVGQPDCAVIRYEDLVADPDGVQARLAAEHSLRFAGRFSEYESISAKLPYTYSGRWAPRDGSRPLEGQRVVRNRIAKWRHDALLVERVREQFSACPELGTIAEAYGYGVPDVAFERRTP